MNALTGSGQNREYRGPQCTIIRKCHKLNIRTIWMLKLHVMVHRTYTNINKILRKIIDGQTNLFHILANLKISEIRTSQIGFFLKYSKFLKIRFSPMSILIITDTAWYDSKMLLNGFLNWYTHIYLSKGADPTGIILMKKWEKVAGYCPWPSPKRQNAGDLVQNDKIESVFWLFYIIKQCASGHLVTAGFYLASTLLR